MSKGVKIFLTTLLTILTVIVASGFSLLAGWLALVADDWSFADKMVEVAIYCLMSISIIAGLISISYGLAEMFKTYFKWLDRKYPDNKIVKE